MASRSKPFELRTNALGCAIGGVPEQQRKPFGYCVLSDAERRYVVHCRELLALIQVLLKRKRLLLVADFTSCTGYRRMHYLLKVTSAKQLES